MNAPELLPFEARAEAARIALDRAKDRYAGRLPVVRRKRKRPGRAPSPNTPSRHAVLWYRVRRARVVLRDALAALEAARRRCTVAAVPLQDPLGPAPLVDPLGL